MTKFNNLNELASYINKLTKESLKSDVGETVKEKMQEHVEFDVYAVYPEPRRYERTGGLKRDIEVRETQNSVEIVPTRTDDGNYIPSIIESGIGYKYSGYGLPYEQPRPFVENTRREIEETGLHVETLKKSLKSKGIDVR